MSKQDQPKIISTEEVMQQLEELARLVQQLDERYVKLGTIQGLGAAGVGQAHIKLIEARLWTENAMGVITQAQAAVDKEMK